MTALARSLLPALDELYAAFADVPRPTRLETAPSRDGRRILRDLTAAPLRQLPDDNIGPYTGWAMTTVGGAADYQHFLPRIVELTVTNPVWTGAHPAVIAGRMNMAQWRTWPSLRSTAILRFFEQAFREALALRPDESQDAEAWLCGLAVLDQPINDLLTLWLEMSAPNAALQLAAFAQEGRPLGESLAEGYWGEAEAVDRVAAWLRGEAVGQKLAAGLESCPLDDRWCFERALRTTAET